jgi:hypothetical protein
LSLTAPRDHAADAVTPHLVAEQYKADLHFNLGGASLARYSNTDLHEELVKELYGRPYLVFISPATVTAEVKYDGIALKFKPVRNKTRGRPAEADLSVETFPRLLLVRGGENVAKFCRGFLRNTKLMELDKASKTVIAKSSPAASSSSS